MVWGCTNKWRLRANDVAWSCCAAWSGGDVDACDGGGGALVGGGRTFVGSCGGGGDCCDVDVGKVVAAPVKRRCRAGLLRVWRVQRLVGRRQWMVIWKVGSQWLKWCCVG